MRVLSILPSYPPRFSGATRFWLHMIPQLQERGIVVDVLYRDENGHVCVQELDGSLLLARKSTQRKGTRAYIDHILLIVTTLWANRGRYRAVFFIGPNEDALYGSIIIKKILGSKIAYRMTMLDEDDPLAIRRMGRGGWLRAFVLRRIDAVVCINPVMAVSAERAGISQGRIYTIPQGTDTELFLPANHALKKSIRKREHLPLDAKIVIFCGTLVERKGVDLLLEAWPEVIASHPTSLLLLVGPEDEESADYLEDSFHRSLARFRRDSSVKDSVRFYGQREDVHELLQASDVFVLPSRKEGTPNALLEAMAAGLPSVVCELPGVSGVVVNDETEALVAPQNDWKQLRRCICRLLDDENLARALGERAREKAVTNYSLVSTADQYARFFRSLSAESAT